MNQDYGMNRNYFENRVTRPVHRQINEEIFDYLHALPRDYKILDVGCGDGFFLFFMKEFGFKNARGIDLSPSFMERARGKGLNVELMDIMEYAPGFEFDLVVMIELIEHVGDPIRVLKRAHDLLKEGGQLLATVPVFDSISSRWSRLRGKATRLQQCRSIDETHVNAFSKGDILRLLEQAGFKVIKLRYCYNPLPYRIKGLLREKTIEILERITLFNNFGDGLFIAANKTQK